MKRESAPKGAPETDPATDDRRQFTRRDEYAACCEAARAAIVKATPTCTRFELRVLSAVVSMTALFSRLQDRVAVSQLASIVYGNTADSVTGYQRDRVSAGLRALHRDAIIFYAPGKGRKSEALVGLPETRARNHG